MFSVLVVYFFNFMLQVIAVVHVLFYLCYVLRVLLIGGILFFSFQILIFSITSAAYLYYFR